jgi:hypothetical protein
MLQNRVDPFGNIIITSARGSWMGNRGVIHNEHKQITKAFKHKAWIICQLEFKGRRRVIMSPDRWTELFFVDEATALAAGHRPCFECRKEDAKRFKSSWIKGNPSSKLSITTSIKYIDEIIHNERIGKKRNVVHSSRLSDLPDGTFVQMSDRAYLFANGALHGWTPFGYEGPVVVPDAGTLAIITPPSIINALREGYAPQIGIL